MQRAAHSLWNRRWPRLETCGQRCRVTESGGQERTCYRTCACPIRIRVRVRRRATLEKFLDRRSGIPWTCGATGQEGRRCRRDEFRWVVARIGDWSSTSTRVEETVNRRGRSHIVVFISFFFGAVVHTDWPSNATFAVVFLGAWTILCLQSLFLLSCLAFRALGKDRLLFRFLCNSIRLRSSFYWCFQVLSGNGKIAVDIAI